LDRRETIAKEFSSIYS